MEPPKEIPNGLVLELIPGDRRNDQRYWVELDLQFRAFHRDQVEACGSGKTVNVGRSGLCFNAPHAFAKGTEVEVVIEWPFLLQNRCPLHLIIRGRIAWCSGNSSGLEMRRYEFRTRGSRSFEPAADLSGTGRNFLA